MSNPKPASLYGGVGDLPDNHVGPDFLAAVRAAHIPRKHCLRSTMLGAAGAVQQLCSIWLLLLCYQSLVEEDSLRPGTSTRVIPASIMVGTALSAAIARRASWHDGCDERLTVQFLMSMILNTGVLYAVAPVLHTLTDAISTNTIHVMAAVMLVINMMCNEYQPNHRTLRVVQGSALNAGTFASVCLASRTTSTTNAFALMLIAMICFAVWPPIRVRIRNMSLFYDVVQTIMMCTFTLYATWVNWPLFFHWLVIQLCLLGIACPWAFVQMQGLKRAYSGPWDEAVVDNVGQSNNR